MTFSFHPASRPLVSVVMANYNGSAHIERAMRSVLAQSLDSLELLVIDDASTDESIAIITRLAAIDGRVRPIFQPDNGGPGSARNRGLELARGDWIAVADADDLFHPKRLERLVGMAEARGDAAIADDLIFFSDTAFGEANHLFRGAELKKPRALSLEDLLDDRFAGIPNHLGYTKPLFRRACLGDLRYRTDLRVGEDFDLLLRFAAAGHEVTIVPETFYLYRRHAGSISHRLSARNATAMLKAMEDLRDAIHPRAADALGRRVRAMRTSVEEAALVEDTKALRFGSALLRVLRDVRAARPLLAAARRRLRHNPRNGDPRLPTDLILQAAEKDQLLIPKTWDAAILPEFDNMSSGERAELTAIAASPECTIHAGADVSEDHLGLLPDATRVIRYPAPSQPLVHVRTPTYKRPDALRRALESLQAQTIEDWICDVYDDDPEQSGEAVVRDLNDPRIRYTANAWQRFASANIDRCFTRFNPHGATYFCCLEDDNQLLPTFFEENILTCELKGVEIVLRNQFVEYHSGTDNARVSEVGLLEEKFDEGICDPETLHLSLMADWGVSNGGLFWSCRAVSDLEVGVPCSAAFQEYLRTRAIVEPIYVALKPLAIWAENGENTERDLGARMGWLRRELGLKRSAQALRRHVWAGSSATGRQRFIQGAVLNYPDEMRANGLVKSLFFRKTGTLLPFGARLRLFLRGVAIRVAGRPMPGLDSFLKSRGFSPSGRV